LGAETLEPLPLLGFRTAMFFVYELLDVI